MQPFPSGLVLVMAVAGAAVPVPAQAEATAQSQEGAVTAQSKEGAVTAQSKEGAVTAPAPKPPIVEVPKLFAPGGLDKRYAIPDLAPDRLLFPRINTPIFTTRPGIELILDYSAFGQDDASVGQVGEQSNGFDVRSASLNFEGELGPKRRIGYKIGVAYNGFNADIEEPFTVTDFNTFITIPEWRTVVRLGQMQEDFGYEVVGSTATMPQSERVLSPFASPVNFGLKVTHMLGRHDRATLTYGIFKDDWGQGDGRPAISARVTLLAIDRPRHYLHLGAAVRRAEVDDTIRLQGRPGVYAADTFVDTGDFFARSSTNLGLEAHYAKGPFSVIAEFASARPDVPDGADPVFRGYYVMGSWVLTGEQREYDRSKGSLKRIMPEGRWGAPELVVRYSAVDLSSGGIAGGRYDRIELGANWWATTRWKFGMIYGHIWLDRFGDEGRTNSFVTRLQWIY
jgi:phosphate-selective porin OprO/OprP